MIQKKSGIQTLNELADVNSPSPQEGQTLTFTNGEWVNNDVSVPIANLDDLGDVAISNPINGQVLIYNQTTASWEAQVIQMPSVENTESLPLRSLANRNPTVAFIIDDTSTYMYQHMDIFTSRGATFTTAFRQDFITSGNVTWDAIKGLQDAGHEIAFHGMHHNYSGQQMYIDEQDVERYFEACQNHGINVCGWVGPNGDYWENFVLGTHGDKFTWARGGGAFGTSYTIQDYFKKIDSTWIDDLTTTTRLDETKVMVDALKAKGTGLLVFSIHWNGTQDVYLEQLLDYIIGLGGITISSIRNAYQYYSGGILEYTENSLVDGTLYSKSEGNGPNSYRAAYPHFVLMKDGTVLSNAAKFKLKPPSFKGAWVKNTTKANEYELGVTAIQYGSTDSTGGFGNATVFTYNFGKSYTEAFQIIKKYQTAGLFYREVDNTGEWKQTTPSDKLGIFRAKPSTPTSPGQTGDFSADVNYLYICYGTNTWIRVAKDSTWV